MRRAQHVTHRRGVDPAVRAPARGVDSGNRLDGHRAECQAITNGRFGDGAELVTFQQPSGPGRHDQVDLTEEAQRRHMEMIHVDVRDQYDIDVADVLAIDGVVPP